MIFPVKVLKLYLSGYKMKLLRSINQIYDKKIRWTNCHQTVLKGESSRPRRMSCEYDTIVFLETIIVLDLIK